MSEDQQTTRCKTYQNQLMQDSGKKFYLDEKSADVFFSFGSGDGSVTNVAAHKILLAIGSDVFDAMFYGELKEKGDVSVVDVSDAAFREFLQYFYLNKVKLTEDNIVGVIELGHKYNVKKCIEGGTQFLIDILDCKNIWIALHLARLYDTQELIEACEKFIIMNTDAVFKSNGFLECDKSVLAHILKMKILSCSEVEVFEACMAWVKAKCGEDSLTKEMVDKHLGKLYYDIRFRSITIQEFCALAAKYESVLRSDCFTLMSMIVTPEFQPEKFNNLPRQADWNEHDVIKCDRALDNDQWVLFKPKNETKFSTNKSLLLGGFVCNKIGVSKTFPIRGLRTDLPVDVEIIEAVGMNGVKERSILKMKTNLRSKDTDVLLPHPVLIRPGFVYTICVEPFPDDHCFCSKELKTKVQLESDATIEFYEYDYSVLDRKVVGLISILNFNRI